MILPTTFYARDTRLVARELLGQRLVCHDAASGARLAGIIVETEAYLADDPACHAFRGETPRNRAMFGPPGTLYVYQIYNHYFCVNVVSNRVGVGEAVLLRALEPTRGVELMVERRNAAYKVGFERYRDLRVDASTPKGLRSLTNGPAKLTTAMGFQMRVHNGVSLSKRSESCVFVRKRVHNAPMVATTRIGIREGVELPYRFYLEGNAFVSRK